MKLDPAIVEAAARALARQRLDFNSRHREPLTPDRYKASEDAGWPNFVPEANVALTAAYPMIEATIMDEITRRKAAPKFYPCCGHSASGSHNSSCTLYETEDAPFTPARDEGRG